MLDVVTLNVVAPHFILQREKHFLKEVASASINYRFVAQSKKKKRFNQLSYFNFNFFEHGSML
jgi:hypothetical protein